MIGRIAIGCALLALLATPAPAQTIDKSCELKLVKVDPTLLNVAFPDAAAAYYAASYVALPGTRLRIQGAFPHARYMSFHVYDAASRPLDALADVELAADEGSTNPFAAGADRRAAARRYTAFVDSGAPPASGARARNTLYAGAGQDGTPNAAGLLVYRVYLPDRGLDDVGGTGLPRVRLETTSGTGGPDGPSLCDGLERPPVPDVNPQLAELSGSPPLYSAEWPGYRVPKWMKFKNLPNSYASLLLDNPYAESLRPVYAASGADGLGGAGAFFSNIHNSYMVSLINRGYGEVLVFRMRVPTFADTRAGAARMPSAQLRYFSICQNEVASTRYVACVTDDQTATVRYHGARYMTFVISASDQRPATARATCGVTWLPWGPSTEGVVIYRQMLAASDFTQAIQRIPAQGQELATMSAYHPRARYFADKHAFEALGCNGAANPPGMATAPAGARRRAAR